MSNISVERGIGPKGIESRKLKLEWVLIFEEGVQAHWFLQLLPAKVFSLEGS